MRWITWIGMMLAAVGIQRESAKTPREAVAELPGVRLFYTDTGGPGVPIVLLHAATGNVRSWEHQIPAFTRAGYRVIAFDRRGWGRTTIDQNGPQPGTAADDLLALMEQLHLERFHVVGTAAGGFVAFDFALSFPNRLRSLVVANSIGGVQDEDFLALGRRLRPPEFAAMPPEVRELSPAFRASDDEGTRRWVEIERSNRPAGAAPTAQPLRNTVTFARLQAVTVPVLLLTGGADMYAPPPVLRLFAARLRASKSLIVPEAGHSTYWEQPDVFNRAVLQFVRKH
jgi:pimeloyl-ACP methyl ester carboxylesterase